VLTVAALLIGVAAGLLAGGANAPASPGQAERPPTARQAAFSAASDYLAPLVRPDHGPVRVSVRYCRKRDRWHGCRLEVRGATVCRGILAG
jgi:hypothetical protein